jgi:hypothetical protein
MSHPPLTNTSSLKIAAAYYTAYVLSRLNSGTETSALKENLPAFICHPSRRKYVAERTLLLKGVGIGQGLVNIRERLGHFLVFYYNMITIVPVHFEVKYISDSLHVFISGPTEIYINLTTPRIG